MAAEGGTVTIDTAGTRTSSGVVLFDQEGIEGDVSAATFEVTGEPEATYTIVLPGDEDVTLDGPDGSTPMTVTAFNSVPAGEGLLAEAGTQTITVGATLNVAANQTPGVYEGNFEVTVTYN